MTDLLYIEASPRKKRSSSIQIANDFLEAYRQSHPSVDIKTIDLWQKQLPAFDGDVIDAKYAIMHGKSHTESQRKSWHAVEELIQEFKQAKKYVFSLPMWNFSIPYCLKHYFDLIVQPTYTFSFSPETGYQGLVTGKTAMVIYSRGGAYGPGSGAEGLDFQRSYIQTILGFIGITDVQAIVVEPTLASQEAKDHAIDEAAKRARELASKW
jgi:FMN-dependent NADH-azoreductase